ncbi:MAG: hypothetical protein A2X61_12005 [Ignavibacteria bacterium GWB2_35_12]|nr:MAG: hypothetical protein A2X63_05845 [Ignavibacteria bacterium GWA2_35_8]OGU41982.1 MAG: hypothetical protein A2X61_12005 [Ignavibacteria bacterium GWB2_35_12]OGU88213.1 MAG: hypothetical protein A2220_14980 [Ignavibacteria bacterium RIFOXYA2_FULL_35_10]OGV24424.1 MAG: hypothetical protein A2475_12595 [Ignavibacteria bacterium RIFOXYC2_FULL_35_21]
MEKVVKIVNKKDDTNDLDYWLSRPLEERLRAVEILRQQYIALLPEDERRFHRVYKVVKREKTKNVFEDYQ